LYIHVIYSHCINAVITGGGSGIGLATAQRFVQEGVYAFIFGRGQSEIDAAARRIGKNVTGVQDDVSNLADLDRLYEMVQQKGRIEVPGSEIKPGDPAAMLVGNTVANPPGDTTPFLTVGQCVRGTYTYSKAVTTTATVSSTNGYGTPTTAAKTFVVSAIMQPTGDSYTDQSIYINEAEGNKLFNKAYKYDSMMIAAKSPEYVNVVAKEITDLYGPSNIGVTTPSAILQTRQQTQSGTAAFTLGIALLVGAVGIITTLYTSVNERVKEIGTMKAIGAKNLFILALFLCEALLIGLLGATSGIFLGIGGAYALSGIAPQPTSGPGGGGGGGPPAHVDPIFIPSDLLHVWILSLLLSLGAGIMPAWKASRLSPLEALRR